MWVWFNMCIVGVAHYGCGFTCALWVLPMLTTVRSSLNISALALFMLTGFLL